MNKRFNVIGRIEGNALGYWYLEEDCTPSIMFGDIDKCTEARDAYFKDLEDNMYRSIGPCTPLNDKENLS